MTDAIGKELKIGDYVTAVWQNGEVALFKFIAWKEASNKGPRTLRYRDVATLERTSDSGYIAGENNKVYKTSSQITWVDKQYVLLNILTR